MGKTRLHTFFQGTIHTGYRQRQLQMRQYILIAISITQQLCLQFRAQIIVERQTRAIRQFISLRVETDFTNQLSLHAPGTLGTGRAVTGRGSYLIVHTLRIEIVAFLHHLVKDLIHRMEAGTHRECTGRTTLDRSSKARIINARIFQLGQESVHEIILSTKYQRRKHRVVIIPAPPLAKQVGIFHRPVGIDVSLYAIHPHVLQTGHEGSHIIRIKTRVHATDAIDVTFEHMIFHSPRIFQLRFKLIRAAQLIKSRNGSYQLHGTGRTHQLALTKTIDTGICLQVPHHDTDLRSLKHLAFQELVDTFLHRLWPRQSQCIPSDRIHHSGIRHLIVVLVLHNLFIVFVTRIFNDHLRLQGKVQRHHS